MTLREMLLLAERIKRLGLECDMRHYGVTVIVHAVEPSSVDSEIAVSTTLPSRAAQRGLLAHAVACSLQADNVELGNASETAARDYDALMGDKRRPE